jgi:uncharacterized protein
MRSEHNRFRRTPLRDSLRPARSDPDVRWRLAGPSGVVAERVEVAQTPVRRLIGLIGRRELGDRDALIIDPCTRVHTVGLRFAIDVVFCDRELSVLTVETLGPRKVSKPVPSAACCIELTAGRAAEAGVDPGARLRLVKVGGPAE